MDPAANNMLLKTNATRPEAGTAPEQPITGNNARGRSKVQGHRLQSLCTPKGERGPGCQGRQGSKTWLSARIHADQTRRPSPSLAALDFARHRGDLGRLVLAVCPVKASSVWLLRLPVCWPAGAPTRSHSPQVELLAARFRAG